MPFLLQTMTVEWLRIRDVGDQGEGLTSFLESHGYLMIRTIEDMKFTTDSIFVKDTWNDQSNELD